MTRDELDTLREGWDFEAKLAAGRDGRGALPDSTWETYSAMANTQGGVILLGAQERPDGSLALHGIAEIDKVERDLWNTLQNPQKVSTNLLGREHVKRVDLEGHALLVIHVPKATRAQRPVFLNGSWERGTYLRVHEGDRVADRDVARRMLADAMPNRDAEPLDGFTRDDLHPETVRRYREFFAARRPGHPFLDEEDEGFLVRVGALARDRASSRMAPTLAGLLMLGEEVAIRELLPHWHLSYREPPDDAHDPRRWLDRLAPDGTWLWEEVEFGETYLELRQESLLPEAAVTALVDRFGEDFRSLDELGRVILVTAEAEGTLSHARIRELSDAHPRDITTRLRDLVRRGFLASVGRTRGMTYSVSPTRSAATSEPSASTSEPSASTSEPSASTSASSASTSASSAATSASSAATSGIPLPARATQDAVREAIMDACSDNFLTVAEIAAKIGRAASTIRIRFLPDLVREGLLRLRFPETPNHPNQAYHATRSNA